MKQKVLFGLLTCVVSTSVFSKDLLGKTETKQYSFQEVSQKLKFQTTTELVERKGMNIWELLGGLTGIGRTFRARLKATTTDPTDFKPAKPKLLHSRGVCAQASWKITEDTGATGLFAKGTEIPAIVRFSTGQDNSAWKEDKPRLFGIGVKLFPSQNKKQKVQTANVFLMSQGGLNGDTRKGFFSKPESQVVYSNVIPEPIGVAQKLLGRLFAKFDPTVIERPLWPAAEVTQENRGVENPTTPFQIKVRAQDFGHKGMGGGDFREEIMSYKADQIKLDLYLKMTRESQEELKAGVLTVGDPFMSDVCDLELHFHHHRNK